MSRGLRLLFSFALIFGFVGCNSGSGKGSGGAEKKESPDPPPVVCCNPPKPKMVCSSENCRFADFSDENFESILAEVRRVSDDARENERSSLGFSASLFIQVLVFESEDYRQLNEIEMIFLVGLVSDLTLGDGSLKDFADLSLSLKSYFEKNVQQGDSRWN